MEMRNNFQSSSVASNIPHLDPNRRTPTINPNEMPQFDQVDPVLIRSIQMDDMELHELLKAPLWPLNQLNDNLNFMLTPLIILNPDPNPIPLLQNQPIIFKKGLTLTTLIIPNPDPNPAPMRSIEMPRLDPTDNVVFGQLWMTMPPPPLMLTPLIIPSPDPNPYPVRRIEMPRLGSTDKVVFEQRWMTMPPPLLPPHNQLMNCSSFDDTAINRTGLLADLVNSCSNNEMHLAAASSPEIPSPSNGAVAATQGRVNSSDIKSKWSHPEHKLFLVGVEIYGKSEWKKIANNVVITKTYKQVASHAKKYFERKGKKLKRASIHDTNTVDRGLLSQVRARLGLS